MIEGTPSMQINNPYTLIELWTEYKFGISGGKAAQMFKFCQRNSSKALKQKYWRRNQVWMAMAGLVNCCGVQGEETLRSGRFMGSRQVCQKLFRA